MVKELLICRNIFALARHSLFIMLKDSFSLRFFKDWWRSQVDVRTVITLRCLGEIYLRPNRSPQTKVGVSAPHLAEWTHSVCHLCIWGLELIPCWLCHWGNKPMAEMNWKLSENNIWNEKIKSALGLMKNFSSYIKCTPPEYKFQGVGCVCLFHSLLYVLHWELCLAHGRGVNM